MEKGRIIWPLGHKWHMALATAKTDDSPAPYRFLIGANKPYSSAQGCGLHALI